tara:strand:- start:415 stop:642 length:228 start_codon:yes stop_codon:yes gene_type:complete
MRNEEGVVEGKVFEIARVPSGTEIYIYASLGFSISITRERRIILVQTFFIYHESIQHVSPEFLILFAHLRLLESM